MAHAAGLRIDHVMGLFRLFWIPEGAEPAQGTYVRYPADDLLGILALESLAAQALVVGEDLGTVEPGVRERLADEGVLSYRLAWFEHGPDGGRRRPADYPRLALAATTTHDLPTVAGFFTGSDLDHLCDIGVATPGGQEQADQEAQRASLCRLLEDEGLLAPGERSVEAIVAALYGFLTRTPCHAGRGHPRGRRRGARPAQRARHHRPAPQLVAAPARPARRPGRRPPGPAARRGPLGGDNPGNRPKLRGSLRELAARAGYDHPRNLHLAGQAAALGGRAT